MTSEPVSSAVICDLLKGSILELCKTSVPKAEGVEVDGIICITLGKHTSEQLVIKVHEILWDRLPLPETESKSSNTRDASLTTNINGENARGTAVRAPMMQRTNKRKAGCPVAIVNAKQPCLDLEQNDSESSLDEHIEKDVRKELEHDNEGKKLFPIKSEMPEDTTDTEGLPYKPICIEPTEVYICDVCKHCFSDHHSYTNHFVLSEKCQVNVNICSYCNLKLYDLKSYVLHLKSHSSESYGEIWKGRPVRCGVCTILLRSKRSISEHMTSSHQHVKCYSCTSCDEIYPDFKTFRLHRSEKHSNVNQCRCDMCELFFSFTEYKDHEKECRIKIHTEEMGRVPEPYQTPVKGFLASPSAHEKEGSNNEVKFSSRLNMTPLCDTSDTSESNSILDTPTLGPFRCQRCFMVFQDFEQYETHNHEMHSRHVCSYCAQSFATKRNLQRHARRHTGVRPYKCLDCLVTFTRDDDLKKHMFRHNHLTGYKGKSPVRPMVYGASSKEVDIVGLQGESSNDSSVIIHQSQEPLYVQVNSGQDEAIAVNETPAADNCRNRENISYVDEDSITIDDM